MPSRPRNRPLNRHACNFSRRVCRPATWCCRHRLTTCPPCTPPASLARNCTGDYVFNRLWTLPHTPCINVPGWRSPLNLPVGLTLTGPRFADRRLLVVAIALQGMLKEAVLRR